MNTKHLSTARLLLACVMTTALVALAMPVDAQPPGANVMNTTRSLVWNYDAIDRTVEDSEDGVRSVTTSEDPQVAALIQTHAHGMKAHLASGGRVRMWDPLFAELVARNAEVDMTIRDLPNGVEVMRTSTEADVQELIRAHAAKVSDMANRGPAAAQEATPLPRKYVAQAHPRQQGPQPRTNPRGNNPGRGCCQANAVPGGRGQGMGQGRGFNQGRGQGMG